MKILVLGATGGTGRQIVRAAEAKGHRVAAIVRSIARAGDLGSAQLIEGSVLNQACVAGALAGCHAVICSLGTGLSPFSPVPFLSSATKILIGAMQSAQVKRVICITGVGAGESRGHGGFFYDRIFQPLLLRQVYLDKDRQEDAIRASTLDWIIVRPTILNNNAPRGTVRALTDLAGFHGGKIARADVADFAVAQVGVDEWLRKSPLITW